MTHSWTRLPFWMMVRLSHCSTVDKEIHEKLQLKGPAEKLHLQWTKGNVRTENSYCTIVNVSRKNCKRLHRLTNFYSVEHPHTPEQSVDVKSSKSKLQTLAHLAVAWNASREAQNSYWIAARQVSVGTVNHVGSNNDPIASKTQLGWTVFGNSHPKHGVVALTQALVPFEKF